VGYAGKRLDGYVWGGDGELAAASRSRSFNAEDTPRRNTEITSNSFKYRGGFRTHVWNFGSQDARLQFCADSAVLLYPGTRRLE
jgi:hypothetical protein